MKGPVLTAERLREVLAYSPETGEFRRLVNKQRPDLVGQVAGTARPDGYRYVAIDGRNYKAHRLAWLFVHGRWPTEHLDHKNGVGDDNRLANLREANRSQNIANSRLRRDNKAGYKGVCFFTSTGKWGAIVSKDKRRHYLGQFDTAEAAHEAYIKKANELHGQFARSA